MVGLWSCVTALFALEESFAGVWFEQKEVEHAKKIKLHDSTRKSRSGGKIELRLVLTLAWKMICSPTSTSIQPLGSCLVTCDFTHLLFKSQIQTQILELAEMDWCHPVDTFSINRWRIWIKKFSRQDYTPDSLSPLSLELGWWMLVCFFLCPKIQLTAATMLLLQGKFTSLFSQWFPEVLTWAISFSLVW